MKMPRISIPWHFRYSLVISYFLSDYQMRLEKECYIILLVYLLLQMSMEGRRNVTKINPKFL